MARKNVCSYSEEEIEKFKKDTRRIPKWGMRHVSGTIYIPYDEIKEEHLINIILHIKEHPLVFGSSILDTMETLYKTRFLIKSDAGKLLYGNK